MKKVWIYCKADHKSKPLFGKNGEFYPTKVLPKWYIAKDWEEASKYYFAHEVFIKNK
ncbi:hypothetical protein UFOVP941_21 [uncultured Caudovirales phage]|uniref:Uncharacterized protein n=1 Tax=uncultured Caudovirales phage TaxID=2100421 RepID=A0A6J5S3B6_9CAUD|nr:hypothetical protein UFOVP941_21 [uncultured Caudovirales phage]CAB4202421.1 hypothetical protein UFOVP1373_16 [uncultured Caudovirales phage]